jgi:hypothetical protein
MLVALDAVTSRYSPMGDPILHMDGGRHGGYSGLHLHRLGSSHSGLHHDIVRSLLRLTHLSLTWVE